MIDLTLGVKGTAWAAAHCLAVRDPDFLPWDKDFHCYTGAHSIRTKAWYNGRETGISITMESPDNHKKNLVIVICQHRSSDRIVVDSWETEGDVWNGVKVKDFPDEAFEKRSEDNHFDSPMEAANYVYDSMEKWHKEELAKKGARTV